LHQIFDVDQLNSCVEPDLHHVRRPSAARKGDDQVRLRECEHPRVSLRACRVSLNIPESFHGDRLDAALLGPAMGHLVCATGIAVDEEREATLSMEAIKYREQRPRVAVLAASGDQYDFVRK
jgi:hypothetical protein